MGYIPSPSVKPPAFFDYDFVRAFRIRSDSFRIACRRDNSRLAFTVQDRRSRSRCRKNHRRERDCQQPRAFTRAGRSSCRFYLPHGVEGDIAAAHRELIAGLIGFALTVRLCVPSCKGIAVSRQISLRQHRHAAAGLVLGMIFGNIAVVEYAVAVLRFIGGFVGRIAADFLPPGVEMDISVYGNGITLAVVIAGGRFRRPAVKFAARLLQGVGQCHQLKGKLVKQHKKEN